MSKFALLFLFLVFGGSFAALFAAPVFAFLVYQLIYFVNPAIRWWAGTIPGIPYSFIASSLMILVLGLRYKALSELAPWKHQPIFKWLVLILIMYVLTTSVALLPEAHKKFTVDLLKLFVIIFVAYKLINSEKALDACLWVYVLGCTYLGYMAYVNGRNAQGRVEGIGMVDTGGDSNMTGAAMVPALVFLMYMAWLGNRKVKLLAVFCGALIANGLVLINSRGAFLGVVAGCGFFLMHMIFSRYRRKGQRAMAIVTIIMGISGGLYVADDTFWERMQTLQTVEEDPGASGSHRIDFWLATFDVIDDYPFGVGILGFIEVSPHYLPEHYFENRDIGKATHSTWFQIFSELGWPGPVLLIALLVSVLRMSRQTKKYVVCRGQYEVYFKILALEGGLLGFLVAASFIDRARAEVLYWLVLFLAVAANIYYLRSGKATASARSTRLNARTAGSKP